MYRAAAGIIFRTRKMALSRVPYVVMGRSPQGIRPSCIPTPPRLSFSVGSHQGVAGDIRSNLICKILGRLTEKLPMELRNIPLSMEQQGNVGFAYISMVLCSSSLPVIEQFLKVSGIPSSNVCVVLKGYSADPNIVKILKEKCGVKVFWHTMSQTPIGGAIEVTESDSRAGWAFLEQAVKRAVDEGKKPVITAITHGKNHAAFPESLKKLVKSSNGMIAAVPITTDGADSDVYDRFNVVTDAYAAPLKRSSESMEIARLLLRGMAMRNADFFSARDQVNPGAKVGIVGSGTIGCAILANLIEEGVDHVFVYDINPEAKKIIGEKIPGVDLSKVTVFCAENQFLEFITCCNYVFIATSTDSMAALTPNVLGSLRLCRNPLNGGNRELYIANAGSYTKGVHGLIVEWVRRMNEVGIRVSADTDAGFNTGLNLQTSDQGYMCILYGGLPANFFVRFVRDSIIAGTRMAVFISALQVMRNTLDQKFGRRGVPVYLQLMALQEMVKVAAESGDDQIKSDVAGLVEKMQKLGWNGMLEHSGAGLAPDEDFSRAVHHGVLGMVAASEMKKEDRRGNCLYRTVHIDGSRSNMDEEECRLEK